MNSENDIFWNQDIMFFHLGFFKQQERWRMLVGEWKICSNMLKILCVLYSGCHEVMGGFLNITAGTCSPKPED